MASKKKRPIVSPARAAPPMHERPRCRQCGKHLKPETELMLQLVDGRWVSQFAPYSGAPVAERFDWTGRYQGFGPAAAPAMFCTTRCAAVRGLLTKTAPEVLAVVRELVAEVQYEINEAGDPAHPLYQGKQAVVDRARALLEKESS